MSRINLCRSLRSVSILAGAALMLSVPVAAQSASYTYIGKGVHWPPLITALNLPKVGTTFKIRVPGGYWERDYHGKITATYQYVLALGTSNPNVYVPWLGGTLRSSADISLQPTIFALPWQTVGYPIPNSTQLLGVRFYQQVLEVWTTPSGWRSNSLSRGGVGVIGK